MYLSFISPRSTIINKRHSTLSDSTMTGPINEPNPVVAGVRLPTLVQSSDGTSTNGTDSSGEPTRGIGFGISQFLNEDRNKGDLQTEKPKLDGEITKDATLLGQSQSSPQLILPTQHLNEHQPLPISEQKSIGVVGPTHQVASHHVPSPTTQGNSNMLSHQNQFPQHQLAQMAEHAKELVEIENNSITHNHNDLNDNINIDKKEIINVIEEFFPHRRNIGSVVYNPTTTWLTLQTEALVGLKPEHQERFLDIKINFNDQVRHDKRPIKYIPVIPPLPFEYINTTIEMKIPYRYIKIFKELMDHNHDDFKRELWGGASGVYTDDSDVLSILVHKGLFTNSIDLSDWNSNWNVHTDFVRPQLINPSSKDNDENDENDGIYGDLSVEVLLLPTLPKYHGFFANGINSRSWIGHSRHDGLSIAICNIKWESFGSYMRDKSLFKISELELHNDLEILREQYQHNSWKFDTQRFSEIKKKYGSTS